MTTNDGLFAERIALEAKRKDLNREKALLKGKLVSFKFAGCGNIQEDRRIIKSMQDEIDALAIESYELGEKVAYIDRQMGKIFNQSAPLDIGGTAFSEPIEKGAKQEI